MENEFQGSNGGYGEARKQDFFMIQKKGIMSNLLLGIFLFCWAVPVSGNTIKFYMLILCSAALLLSLIRTQSLSENHDGFSI